MAQITTLKRLILEATDPHTGRRLTNYKIAAAVGLHPSTLSAYANAKWEMPYQHRNIIAEYFNVPASSLDQLEEIEEVDG